MHLANHGVAELSLDGVSWTTLPGVSRVTRRPRSRRVRERRDVDGVKPVVSRPSRPGQLVVTVPDLRVADAGYDLLRRADATEAGTIHFRFSIPGRLRASPSGGARVLGIDGQSGRVNFTSFGQNVDFTARRIKRGMVLRTEDGRDWQIRTIDGPQGVIVVNNGVAVGSENYTVWVPKLVLGPHRCALTSFGNVTAARGNPLGTSFTLQPYAQDTDATRLRFGDF